MSVSYSPYLERIIPAELLEGVGTIYEIHGGTIRYVKGHIDGKGGQIVRHIIFPPGEGTEDALESLQQVIQQNQQALEGVANTVQVNQQMLQGIKAMQHLSIALQGANLAVSAAGFAMVLNKLDKIHQQINVMDAKLDSIQQGVGQLNQRWEQLRSANYRATFENLESALRQQDIGALNSAVFTLREHRNVFQDLASSVVVDVKQVYFDPSDFRFYFEAAMHCSFAIANAFAQIKLPEESVIEIQKVKDWQAQLKDTLLAPVKKRPLWLATLSEEQRVEIKDTLDVQRAMPQNIVYLEDTYTLCHQSGHSVEELIELQTKGDPLLFAA